MRKVRYAFVESAGAFTKGHASQRVMRRVGWCRPMHRANKPAKVHGHRVRIKDESRGVASAQPWQHAPRPRVAAAWCADTSRHRYRHRQSRRKQRQPSLFVDDQVGRHTASRQPHDEIVSEPVKLVVPTGSGTRQRQFGEIRMLGPEQRAHECLVNLDVRGRNTSNRHVAGRRIPS